MERIDNTRRNRNFLRLAALGAVVLLEATFGGSRLQDRTADSRHSSAAISEIKQTAVFERESTQARSGGGQNNQLSLMIFRGN